MRMGVTRRTIIFAALVAAMQRAIFAAQCKQYLVKEAVRYRWPDKLTRWAAFHLPRRVAMWAFIRVSGHASGGQWGNERPDTMTVITCLERWDVPREAETPRAVSVPAPVTMPAHAHPFLPGIFPDAHRT